MIFDPAINVVRKGALAYIGALALTSDTVGEAFDTLAKRGVALERSARERFERSAEGARKQFEQTTRRLGLPANLTSTDPAAPVAQTSRVLARNRDRLLESLHLPTQTTLHELSSQVDHLSTAIDELRAQMRRAKAEPQPEPQPEPLPGYDKMNVDTVVGQLAKFDATGLRALRLYEQQHGKRITVLRAVDERLASPVEVAE